MRPVLLALLLGSLALGATGAVAQGKKETETADRGATARIESWLDAQRVTCDFKHATLAKVIMETLCKCSGDGTGVACDPGFDMSLKVTLALEKAPLRKALEVILEKAGGRYEVYRGVLYLAPKEGAAPEPPEPELTDRGKKLADTHVGIWCREGETLDDAVGKAAAGGYPLTVDGAVAKKRVLLAVGSVTFAELIDILCRITHTKVEKGVFKKM